MTGSTLPACGAILPWLRTERGAFSGRATGSSRSGCSGPPARSGSAHRSALPPADGRKRRGWRRPRRTEDGPCSRSRGCPGRPAVPRDGVAHQRAQFLFRDLHRTSTWSMMPTIAASTGAAFRPSASPAARPSSTTSTFSCTPAPTPSTASSAAPRGVSSRFSGCTSSSFAPSNFAVLLRRDDRADDARDLHRSQRSSDDPSDRRCRRCRHRPAARPDRTESSLPCRGRRTLLRRRRRRPRRPRPAAGRPARARASAAARAAA